MTNACYLIEHPSAFLFRIRVPQDLRPHIGKTEIRYSLKTGRLREAKPKARLLAGMVQRLFRQLRRGDSPVSELTPPEVSRIIEEYIREVTEEKERARLMTPRSTAQIAQKLDVIDECQGILEHAHQRSNFEPIEDHAKEILSKRGIEFMPDEYAFKLFCSELVKATHLIMRQERDTLTESLAEATAKSPASVKATAISPASPAPTAPLTPTAPATLPEPEKPSSPLLSKVIESFLTEKKGEVNEKAHSSARAKLMLFLEVIGDNPVDTITRDQMVKYRDTLKKLPPNMNKKKEYRGRSVSQILKASPKETMSVHTINSYMEKAQQILEYAHRQGYCPRNTAKDLKLRHTVRSDEERRTFTHEELVAMFVTSPEFAENKLRKPYQFWGPLLGLFTGARVNEISQLNLDDFREDEGVWYIDINVNTPDKKLKNQASHRKVPLHPFLVDDLGLVRYVEKLRAEGETRLFPEVPLGRDGYGRALSSWFNDRFKKKYVADKKDEGKATFHSLRHTFITTLGHAGLNDHALKALVGHAEPGITHARYCKREAPQLLIEPLIEYLEYGLDLSHLKANKFAMPMT